MKKRIFAAVLACALLSGCGPVVLEDGGQTAERITVAYVPLDERPDNLERAVYLAESLGYTLAMPETDDYRTRLQDQPLNENGTQYGDRADLYEWVLDQEEAGCDRYILSMDQLLSGGLVNSRSMWESEPVTLSDGTTLTEAELLDHLLTTLAEDKNNEVWLLESVMRLAPTVGYDHWDLDGYNALRSYGMVGRPQVKKSTKGAGLFSMAWANLGRSRSKTVVTVLSLSLAVVLLNMTVTFTGGFDMDKYLANNVVSDFILADAGYFQVGGDLFHAGMSLPEDAIKTVTAQGGVANGGRIYGRTSNIQEFVDEDYYRSIWSRWNPADVVDQLVAREDRNEAGQLSVNAQLFGMEPFALDQLTVLEGDLSKLHDPDGRYIAAVYGEDDYGNPEMGSHWARLGDTVTLRYVDEIEYYYTDTGEIIADFDQVDPDGARDFDSRVVSYRDVEYTVAALVSVPHAISYRYYGSDEFVLNAQTFIQDTGTDKVMLYAFNMEDDAANDAMESFLADYTETQAPQYDYESKATYEAEFESFRSMFFLLGSVLSFIVGLVGILNFFNAILTGILTRRREFAVLQSVGMTGRQLKTMLVWEGLLYGIGTIGLAVLLSVVAGPQLGTAMNSMFWFFSYRFTLLPILAVLPVFLLLGVTLPLGVYHFVAKSTIVERLRETE